MRFGMSVVLLAAFVSLCMLAGCSTTPALSPDQKAALASDRGGVLRASPAGASISPRTHRGNLPSVKGSSNQVVVAGPATLDRANGGSGIEKSKPGEILTAKRGGFGGSDGYFQHAQARAENPSRYAYVVPSQSHRVERTAGGTGSTTKWGTLSRREGQFGNSTGEVLDNSADMCVTDRFEPRIQKLTLVPWLPSTCGGQFLRIR